MSTFNATRNYLLARQKILEQEMGTYGARANDNRASHHTRREWRDCLEFARSELELVRLALSELPPPEPK